MVAVCAVAAVIYFLFFARVSFESITISANQGETAVTARSSGQQSWISTAEPMGVAVMLVLSLLLFGGALAAWRGALLPLAAISVIALIGSYITGFSIGVLYLPGALGLVICTILTGLDQLLRRRFAVHGESTP